MAEYEATVGPTRTVVTTAGDAVDAIRTRLDGVSGELAAWEDVSRATAFG